MNKRLNKYLFEMLQRFYEYRNKSMFDRLMYNYVKMMYVSFQRLSNVISYRKDEVIGPVYKYTYSQFNPLNGCKTIALGTTRMFRLEYEKENNLINDPDEVSYLQ